MQQSGMIYLFLEDCFDFNRENRFKRGMSKGTAAVPEARLDGGLDMRGVNRKRERTGCVRKILE